MDIIDKITHMLDVLKTSLYYNERGFRSPALTPDEVKTIKIRIETLDAVLGWSE